MKPRFIVAAIVLALLGLDGVARADEFLKPGDSMTLELPIENGDSGGAKATGVTLVPTFEEVSPAGFAQYLSIDQQGSVLGPFDIEVGADKAKTFKAKVVLAANASVDGTFKVKLRLTEASNNRVLMPDPETLDTSVLGRSGFARAFHQRIFARKTVSTCESGASAASAPHPIEPVPPSAPGIFLSGDSCAWSGGLRRRRALGVLRIPFLRSSNSDRMRLGPLGPTVTPVIAIVKTQNSLI